MSESYVPFAGLAPAIVTPLEVEPDWNPRLDAGFKTAWLNWLIRHPDDWLHPTDIWRPRDEWQRHEIRLVAYEAVKAARRCGHVIDGDTEQGYCWRSYHLPRYLHLKERAPQAAPLPPQLALGVR